MVRIALSHHPPRVSMTSGQKQPVPPGRHPHGRPSSDPHRPAGRDPARWLLPTGSIVGGWRSPSHQGLLVGPSPSLGGRRQQDGCWIQEWEREPLSVALRWLIEPLKRVSRAGVSCHRSHHSLLGGLHGHQQPPGR